MEDVRNWNPGITRPTKYMVQQDRQCTYNVTLRRICATIVVVEEQYVLHVVRVCVFSLRYPACNAHAPYYHLWHLPL
jgi:hypothetical protein